MGLGSLVETKRLEIQIEQLEVALAKAEAERDEYRKKINGADCPKCAFVEEQRDSERARAEKYLAALQVIVELDNGDRPELWRYSKQFEAARAGGGRVSQAQKYREKVSVAPDACTTCGGRLTAGRCGWCG